jgi:pimeloyl-ACP methyl ester carboxylesterase
MSEPVPESHHFVSQRLRLNYWEWGNPTAPPLILVHGGMDHARSWDWVAHELRDRWRIIAPDLRGHGDSAWVSDGNYPISSYVYDLAELIEQLQFAEISLVGHSLGGNIATRYTGLYPNRVRRLVSIEGLGLSPAKLAERMAVPADVRWRRWIDEVRGLASRAPRRYASLDEAIARMQAENTHLSVEQVRHLTLHGVRQNDDGTVSWKFDNSLRVWPPLDFPQGELEQLWASITCPTLLCYGTESWASNPEKDGRANHFRNARVAMFPDAGHWLHHDQLNLFMAELDGFL